MKVRQPRTSGLPGTSPAPRFSPRPFRAEGTIQRYRSVAAADYTATAGEEKPLFTLQGRTPSLAVDPEGSEGPLAETFTIEHDVTTEDTEQDLLVADDSTMAVRDDGDEPKELYATTGVLQTANGKLAQVGSSVTLESSAGNSLEVEGNTLVMATPEPSQDEAEEQAGRFADLAYSICIEMASSVLGAGGRPDQMQAVLQGDDGRDVATNLAPDSDTDPKVGRLAAKLPLARRNEGVDSYRTAMHETTAPVNPGRAYGTQAGQGQLGRKAKKLGINEAAAPEVGEGFATFSVGGDASGLLDYSAPGNGPAQRNKKDVWGYHFAGVVAKSADNKDSATLENYNRKDDISEQLATLLDGLVEDHADALGDKLEQVRRQAADSRSDVQEKLIAALRKLRRQTEEAAHEEVSRIMASAESGQRWFFRMYGSQETQTFHERQAASGAFVNPLTLRVRKQDPATEALRSQLSNRLGNIPRPPALLAGEPSFAGYDALKRAQAKTITDAETLADVKRTYNAALQALAAARITALVAAATALAQERGVESEDDFDAGAYNSVSALARAAALHIQELHDDLETERQGLWFWETEKAMALDMAIYKTFAAWQAVPLVAAFARDQRAV
jgi:hypothetical protein